MGWLSSDRIGSSHARSEICRDRGKVDGGLVSVTLAARGKAEIIPRVELLALIVIARPV